MAEHAEEALAARLVETYSDRLLRLAYSILNSVPDAQDVCQEVLLKRLEYPGAFENEKHEQAWMVRVTVNACKNVRRSPWRTRTVGLDAVAEPAAFQPEEGGVLEEVQRLPAIITSPRYTSMMQIMDNLKRPRKPASLCPHLCLAVPTDI